MKREDHLNASSCDEEGSCQGTPCLRKNREANKGFGQGGADAARPKSRAFRDAPIRTFFFWTWIRLRLQALVASAPYFLAAASSFCSITPISGFAMKFFQTSPVR